MIYIKDLRYYNNPFEGLFEVKDLSEYPEDKDIYAFAYKEDERATNLHCPPTVGRIVKHSDRYFETFHEYKKNGKDLKSSYVNSNARYYVDSIGEAVSGYNYLIAKRVDKLKDEIYRLERMML